jgi:hypothetical protein
LVDYNFINDISLNSSPSSNSTTSTSKKQAATKPPMSATRRKQKIKVDQDNESLIDKETQKVLEMIQAEEREQEELLGEEQEGEEDISGSSDQELWTTSTRKKRKTTQAKDEDTSLSNEQTNTIPSGAKFHYLLNSSTEKEWKGAKEDEEDEDVWEQLPPEFDVIELSD